MASNTNRVILSGRLTRDPELRTTGGGTPVCEIGLAFTTQRKDGDEWVDESNFVNVTVWGKRGETVARLKVKGDPVIIDGRLRWRQWETDDGSKRSVVEVVADSVEFISTRGGEQADSDSATPDSGPGF